MTRRGEVPIRIGWVYGLGLIQQIADGLERDPKFTSVQSLALDIDRVSNKTRLAQAPGQGSLYLP